jgi:hypothetical protein
MGQFEGFRATLGGLIDMLVLIYGHGDLSVFYVPAE